MDADLIKRWQHGWARCRDLGDAPESGGALHVRLGLPGRHLELIAISDDDRLVGELADRAIGAGEPTWLTVITERPAAASAVMRGHGLSVGPPEETFMTADLVGGDSPDPALDVRVHHGPATVRAEIIGSAGAVHARGMVGLNGADAVAHDVYTSPQQRGRGLATVVMNVLVAEAIGRGATTGLLIASADGRRLYQRLGWVAHAQVVVGRSASR